jgi:hypothetical protein
LPASGRERLDPQRVGWSEYLELANDFLWFFFAGGGLQAGDMICVGSKQIIGRADSSARARRALDVVVIREGHGHGRVVWWALRIIRAK